MGTISKSREEPAPAHHGVFYSDDAVGNPGTSKDKKQIIAGTPFKHLMRIFFFFFGFLGPHSLHMEVPRLGV